jgi:VWFA-related protein
VSRGRGGAGAGVAIVLAGALALAPATADGRDGAREKGARGDDAGRQAPGAPLSPAHRDWLAAIAPLASEEEREAFVGLGQGYRREAFIEEFWRVRDPHPETPRNELRERWEARYAEAHQRFGEPDDPRVGWYALFGAPSLVFPGRCQGLLDPLEIWRYEGGLVGRGRVHLIFVERPGAAAGAAYRLWSPSDGLGRISTAAAPTPAEPGALLRALVEGCFRGDEVAAALVSALDWPLLRERGDMAPDPGREWLATFLGRSTELPAGAGTFDARLALSFPGRHQSRTVLQGLIAVPREAAMPDAASGSLNFAVDGEVLRKGELFESFRYRFHLPAADVAAFEAAGEAGESVPLLFQRHLRPGVYELVVRVEDLASGRFFRDRRQVEVPAISARARGAENGGQGNGGETGREEEGERSLFDVMAGRPADAARGSSPDGAGASGDRAAVGAEASAFDPAAEANAALDAGEECGLRLLPPPPGLQTGPTRVEAVITGGEVGGVSFALDGRPVAVKNRPPYSIEVDLGETPRTHLVTAAARGPGGDVLARDEMVINAGPHRFAVRLVEPAPGRRYGTSLRAQAEVEVPEGDRLDRLELYLNDDHVATLYQPPLTHPVLLPRDLGPAYVRAVAYLDGGHSAEDLVYVNAPDHLDQIEVRMVELYTSALDRRGRPVDDLGRDDFVVREEGEPQELRRFERVRDLPIWAGLLLDRSNSMAEEIREVTDGALAFFEQVLTPKDRAAVLTFNHEPELLVRFTADPEVLVGGVAGIRAEGGTALYDSLIYALYYFSGINGKRALLVISDGEDEGSRYGFDDALDYARRTGVAIYTIGLGLPGGNAQIRMQLQRLASETGGRSFLISRASDLEPVYESIEEELRTQYLLAYQSTYGGTDTGFREVDVEVNRSGVRASTIRGYFPW